MYFVSADGVTHINAFVSVFLQFMLERSTVYTYFKTAVCFQVPTASVKACNILCHAQVAGRVASAAAQAAAARLGGGRAAHALELVGFDADLGAAMRYVFGNAFVCQARAHRARSLHTAYLSVVAGLFEQGLNLRADS